MWARTRESYSHKYTCIIFFITAEGPKGFGGIGGGAAYHAHRQPPVASIAVGDVSSCNLCLAGLGMSGLNVP